MLADTFSSPADICRAVASRMRDRRLAANLTQEGLAHQAGVSLGSLKRFEREGAASFELIVRIAIVLRMEDDFDALFRPQTFASLDDAIRSARRRRRARQSKSP